jgi:hypothetical protein
MALGCGVVPLELMATWALRTLELKPINVKKISDERVSMAVRFWIRKLEFLL